MKNLLFSILLLSLSLSLSGFYSCVTIKPKDFTYLYTAQNTGIDTLINIDGCYVSQRGCDSTFYSVFMFYPDGLFTIATTSNPSEFFACFENGGDSTICQYPSWGTYRIQENIIKTQALRIEGVATATIFRDYRINDDRSLTNISDYVHSENTKLGYMQNYPSIRSNECPQIIEFRPLIKKRSIRDCPFIVKKWFCDEK